MTPSKKLGRIAQSDGALRHHAATARRRRPARSVTSRPRSDRSSPAPSKPAPRRPTMVCGPDAEAVPLSTARRFPPTATATDPHSIVGRRAPNAGRASPQCSPQTSSPALARFLDPAGTRQDHSNRPRGRPPPEDRRGHPRRHQCQGCLHGARVRSVMAELWGEDRYRRTTPTTRAFRR